MIPQSAITSALTPIQQQINEAARARKVQATKNIHHAEDVEELGDTGVENVGNEKQGGGRRQQKNKKGANSSEDNVDIEALKDQPLAPNPASASPPRSNLDISA